MLIVETIRKIRLAHYRDKKSLRQIAREFNLSRNTVRKVIRSDAMIGPELTSVKLAEWAEEHGVELEFIQPGKPMQNGFIERFNRTYREEVLNMYFSGGFQRSGQ
jgi:transposase InsO family protein